MQPTSQSTNQQVYLVTFYHPKLVTRTIPMRTTSCLYQFRSTIAQRSLLKLFENYQFVFQGQVLPQMTPVGLLLPESKELLTKYNVDVRLIAFDERSAKYHLKQVFEMISNPIMYQLYNMHKQQPSVTTSQQPLSSSLLTNPSLTIPSSINQAFNHISQLLPSYYKTPHPQLIQFLSLSGFNPPSQQYQLDGHLFYIHLRVLQGVDYHITSVPNGFYVNNSRISAFNPQKANGQKVHVSLWDLIRANSQKFNQKLQQFVSAIKIDQNDKFLMYFKQPHYYKYQDKAEQEHTWNSKKSMAFYLKQSSTMQLQDWNQSFHVTDNMSPQVIDQFQLYDTRFKLYKAFEQCAIQGAMLLIDGKISPLNPLQQKKKQIYIHNKIFFSISAQTPFSHSQQKGQQAAPSSSAINTDLLNLQTLYNLKIPQLNVLHMVLIGYKGYKVIAQCIIPGILSAEQNLCSQYGSIDDGKTVQTNTEFQKIMVQVAHNLQLQDHLKVLDGNGVEKSIAVSPDIKGILGSNQKKYILDLLRLSPRDLNYPQIQNQTCVLRPELIQAFKKYKAQKKETFAKINTNIGTGISFVTTQQTAKQKLVLQQMSGFLINHSIPRVISSLKSQGSTYLTTSSDLSTCFHQHGVNLRYLGQVHSHPQLNTHNHIKLFLQRVILTKCLKHLFRMAMRETNGMYLGQVITRLLNSIFGNITHLQLLQSGTKDNQYKDDQLNKDAKKKKKKNKNLKDPISIIDNVINMHNESQSVIKIPVPVYLNMKPSELYEIVKKLAKCRYSFELKPTLVQLNQSGIFSLPFSKLATLQDVCLLIGLTLQQIPYPILQSTITQHLPFHPRNLLSIIPRSKHMRLSIPKQPQLLSLASQATEKYKIKQAMQFYNTLLELYMSVSDVEKICQVYSKLGNIYYVMMEYNQAISRETSALKIYQMGLRNMSHKVVHSYSKLGLYDMVVGNRSRALYFFHKSLFMMLTTYGQTYPDILVTLANISRIYRQDKQLTHSISCYLKALQLLKPVTYKYHINISFCYSSLASLHLEQKDIKKAIEYQTESVATLCEILNENDTGLQDAKKILKVYHDLAHKGSVYMPQQVPINKTEQKKK